MKYAGPRIAEREHAYTPHDLWLRKGYERNSKVQEFSAKGKRAK
jgi:hypothetical protein